MSQTRLLSHLIIDNLCTVHRARSIAGPDYDAMVKNRLIVISNGLYAQISKQGREALNGEPIAWRKPPEKSQNRDGRRGMDLSMASEVERLVKKTRLTSGEIREKTGCSIRALAEIKKALKIRSPNEYPKTSELRGRRKAKALAP